MKMYSLTLSDLKEQRIASDGKSYYVQEANGTYLYLVDTRKKKITVYKTEGQQIVGAICSFRQHFTN